MADKKYKYSVKRFAKMLTVHPDKRVTFEDSIDIRRFFTMKIVRGGPWHDSLTQLIVGTVQDISSLQENEMTYWADLVEHGDAFSAGTTGDIPVRVIHCAPPFHVRVEFEVPADKLADWLAKTGFPQMSRAKEPEPDQTM
jgi:hypothetical protein